MRANLLLTNPLFRSSVAVSMIAIVVLAGCASPRGGSKPAPATGPSASVAKPPQIAVDPTPAQEIVLIEANTKTDTGEYQTALVMFNELLSDNPTLVDAHLGIGRTYEKMGDLDKAEPAYARAAALESDNFDAQFGHARVLSGLKRWNDAIRAYHRALVVRPDSLAVNTGMTEAYLKLNQAEEALTFAQKSVELAPADGEARVRLAVALERVGRNEDAIKAYETALELVEPRDDVLTSLVNLYAIEKRYIEAINAANELVRLKPSANAYERLGWAYFRVGDYEKSAAAYKAGVELDPEHWPSLNGIATNALNRWLQSGRTDDAARMEARSAFQRSLKLHGDQPKVVAIMTRYSP